MASANKPQTQPGETPGTKRDLGPPNWGVVFRNSGKAFFLMAAPLIGLLVFWELLAHSGTLHPVLFPPLETIWVTMVDQAKSGILWLDIYVSLYRLLVGAFLALVSGTVVGLVMGMNQTVERILAPPMYFFLAVPGLALFPIVILWFGLSDFTLISVLWFEGMITVMVNAWTGVKTVDASLIRAGRAMGAKGMTLFFQVMVPGALPNLIAGYRIAFSRAWRIVVTGEMIVALEAGLGFRIFAARDFLAADMMYGGVVVVGILGVIVERVCLRSIELATVQRWGTLRE